MDRDSWKPEFYRDLSEKQFAVAVMDKLPMNFHVVNPAIKFGYKKIAAHHIVHHSARCLRRVIGDVDLTEITRYAIRTDNLALLAKLNRRLPSSILR